MNVSSSFWSGARTLHASIARGGLVALLVFAGWFAVGANAQSVRWDPPAGQLGFNQVSRLTLNFESCEPDVDKFKLPAVEGLLFGRPQSTQSSSFSIVNGREQSSTTYSVIFPVRPTARTPIKIPEFEVSTDKGPLRVPAAQFTVGDATVGNTGLSMDEVANAKLSVPKESYWVGEVIPVTYTLSVLHRYFHSPATFVDWPSAPLIAEEWTRPDPVDTVVRGEQRIVATQTTHAYAKQAGSFTLKPATQLINVVVGSTGFGLFSTPSIEQRALSTDPLSLEIRPLPAAPPGFSGAIGQFSLVSKVVPTAPAVGEPVTWTLELAGTGNWPDISGLPQREASNDFQVVQPKSKRVMKDNSLFEGRLTEDVVLVPTKAGHYTLGPVKFIYFDTAAGEYKTITTDPVTVEIAAAPGQQTPAATGPVQFSLNPGATHNPPPAAKPPVPPENLPRDPVAESRTGLAPLGVSELFLLCAAGAVLIPLLVWLVLAALHSRAADPQLPRRNALTRIFAALGRLRGPGAPSEAGRAALRTWQHETTALWEIGHAAPSAEQVQAAIVAHGLPATAAAPWATLWHEADRAQHSRLPSLPADWTARADAAAKAVKLPEWSWTALFAFRHLFPPSRQTPRLNSQTVAAVVKTAACGLILFALAGRPPSASAADAGLDAYRKGDFAAAENSWRSTTANEPSDWAARHNLGLALSQQDRWAEATAEWTGAFLLAPRADETRADLALGLQRSGLAPEALVDFSRGHGQYGLARFASPGEWQFLLIAASLGIAAALVVLLLNGYGRVGAWARPVALATVLGAILLAGCATLSLRTYGPLAHPQAVLVWRPGVLHSIPTEVDSTQKTTPLSAGSIAVAASKNYPGWTKLVFTGGQSGWVRNEDLIRLYR